MKSRRITLSIQGLACGGGGALTLERALEKVPGVARAYVSPATEMAYVEYDAERVDPEQLIVAVERLGFGAGEPSVR